jgi:hypothetical protein
MKRSIRSLLRIWLPAFFALLARASTASAQMDTHGPALEVFSGYFVGYSSGNGFSLGHEKLGARGSYRLTRAWAVEASISRTEDFFIAWNYELSAKGYLLQRDRFGLYALAGPGYERLSFDGEHGTSKTVHAGIGADIALPARAYLRPEILARWPTDHINDRNRTMDYTLGIGWRF